MTAEQRLKDAYPKTFRMSFLLSLVIMALMFLFIPEIKVKPYQLRERQEIVAIEIPDQIQVPPPPKEEAKPQIPTEIEPSEEATAEETIASTELNIEAPPELPPAPTRTEFFTAYDTPPQVIRQVPPEYPELAKMSELEGVVMVQIGVDEFGNVVEARVLQGIEGLNQAAIDAVMQWKFTPAKQRDVPVPVRIVVPIRFVLRG
jgi:protein TonB